MNTAETNDKGDVSRWQHLNAELTDRPTEGITRHNTQWVTQMTNRVD